MTEEQKEIASNAVASIVVDWMVQPGPIPIVEEVKRRVLVAVDALTAAFAKINEAN